MGSAVFAEPAASPGCHRVHGHTAPIFIPQDGPFLEVWYYSLERIFIHEAGRNCRISRLQRRGVGAHSRAPPSRGAGPAGSSRRPRRHTALRRATPHARIPCTGEAVHGEALAMVFLATPAEVSMELAPAMLAAGARVIDLSGAFRLRTPENYTAWYKEPHTAAGTAGRGRLRPARILPRAHPRARAWSPTPAATPPPPISRSGRSSKPA